MIWGQAWDVDKPRLARAGLAARTASSRSSTYLLEAVLAWSPEPYDAGAANFTDRGQTRNIQIGLLFDDASFGRQVALQWQGLVNQELVQRVVP